MMTKDAILEAVNEPAAESTRRSPRDRIISVAGDLFCRDGIHATGIDRILAAAGVSKMTLYARFGSNGALVREVLQQEGVAWRQQFFAAVEAASEEPRARLRAIIPVLATWFRGERFYGCAFMNAVAEHTKGESMLRDLAAEHHCAILSFLGGQAAAAGSPEPGILARQLLLMMDGMIAAYMVSGDDAILMIAGRNLDAVLDKELGALAR